MRRRGLLLAVVTLPVAATPEVLTAAVQRFSAGTPLREGRVRLEVAPLVENGNAVPVRLFVEPPAPGVRRLALLAEGNPQPEVIECQLSAASSRAELSTRIRLATSQTLVALAELVDGSCWQSRVSVVVTLAACVEGG